MKIKKRFESVLKEEGAKELLNKLPRSFYREIFRKILPTVGYVIFNGIKVQPIKIGDRYLPWDWRNYVEEEKAHYETALINGLKTNVKKGDHIVIIGGGNGVTVVIASRLTGSEGKVTCYEASKESIKKIRRTIIYNNCPSNIEIYDKCVGKPVSIWGDMSNEKFMDAALLPDCDILELDCEGSEKEILENLQIRPRTILVETHGLFNSSTKENLELLKKLKYKAIKVEIADIHSMKTCEKSDIKVIMAHK